MQQPGSQVEDATVTHPGVPMEGDRAEGGQILQEPVREVVEPVVVELEFDGPSRESGGQRGGVERPAAAVHLIAVTGAKVGAC